MICEVFSLETYFEKNYKDFGKLNGINKKIAWNDFGSKLKKEQYFFWQGKTLK